MVILFISAAVLGATIVYSIIHAKKAGQELANLVAEKDSIADALRAYIAKLERDEVATQAYVTQLKSNLQSCTDKAKAAAKSAKSTTTQTEKKPVAMGAPVKKRTDKKTS